MTTGTLVHWAADDAWSVVRVMRVMTVFYTRLVFLSFHMATTSIYTRIFSNQTFLKCEKALEGDQLGEDYSRTFHHSIDVNIEEHYFSHPVIWFSLSNHSSWWPVLCGSNWWRCDDIKRCNINNVPGGELYRDPHALHSKHGDFKS